MLYLTSLCHSLCLIAQLCPTVCNPMDCSPPGSSIHGDSLRKNIGVGCHAFLQGILPTQGLNPGLLHCRQIPYHLSHWEPSLRLLIQDLKGWHHQGITFNMSANLESPAVVIGLEKVNPHRSTKECANHQTTALIPHASKVMLKISHARLQYYVNQELPDVQTGFRKGRGTRDQISNIRWIVEKQGNSRKTSTSVSLTMLKPLTGLILMNRGTLLMRWNTRPTYLSPEKPVCESRSSSQNPVWNNWWFKIEKGVRQSCLLSPCLFNLYAEHIIRNAGLDEFQARIKIGGRNHLRYVDDTTIMAESKELKSLLMRVKEESERVGLKLNIKKTKIMASGPITSWYIEGEKVEVVTDFLFLGSKITADGDCSCEIRR